MAKRRYGHKAGDRGGVIPDKALPRRLRGYDEYDVHTFKEGPIRRLLDAIRDR